MLQSPFKAREIAWGKHLAIEVVSANAHSRRESLHAADPARQKSGGGKIVSPDRCGGPDAHEPIDQVQGVRQRRIPLPETAYAINDVIFGAVFLNLFLNDDPGL